MVTFRGHARLYLPPLRLDGEIRELIDGFYQEEDFADFKTWAARQGQLIRENQRSEHPYHKLWAEQQIEDVERAMQTGYMLAGGGKRQLALRRIVMEPATYHTVFLVLDRPQDARVGEWFELSVVQSDVKREEILGGQDLRVEIVPEPDVRPPDGRVHEQTGVQFRGTVPAGRTRKWFTHGWPAEWHVIWTVVPVSRGPAGAQVRGQVQAERAADGTLTYWITVTNGSREAVDVEGRYTVLNA